MKEPILLFAPDHAGRSKESHLAVVPLFLKSLGLCSKYLFESQTKHLSVQQTDDYIRDFWQLNFVSTESSLYVTGRELLPKNQACVFMSNHTSWMDIPAMFGAVPSSLRMVSKKGIMQIPIIGTAMKNAGFVPIDRSNRNRAIKQLEVAKDRLKENISIWIAPEGTRSRDDTIAPFKKGGFYLAKDLGLPIVPAFIEGAREVMPPDGVVIKTQQKITVHFCAPIYAEDYEGLPLKELIERVRLAIVSKQEDRG